MDLILLLKIIFLSFVQGVSEFFPISSSGHLVLFQDLLNFRTIPLVYDIFFHLGTLLAVLIYFAKDLWQIITGLRQKENIEFIVLIIVALIPTATMGLFFKDELEGLFNRPELVGYFLIGTGIFLFLPKLINIKKPNPYLGAFLIGLFQGLAIIPGLSRSGLTISVGLILSMGFLFSFRFSFILSIPAILGALILESDKIPISDAQMLYLLTGTFLSALFGLAALNLLRKIVLKDKFHYFSLYCILAGIMALAL